MNQKVGVPMIIVAVIAVLALGVFFYKQFLGPSPTNTGEHTYPSFIDPATGRPKAGASSSSGAAPGASMQGNMSGGAMSGGAMSGGR